MSPYRTIDLSKQIRARIAELLAGDCSDSPLTRAQIERFDVLPLAADMGGCVAIRPDGTLVSHAWDTDDVYEETRELLRVAALVQGARRYPELAPLVPVRTADAITCPHCDGTGVPNEVRAMGDDAPNNIVCRCAGLGWIKA